MNQFLMLEKVALVGHFFLCISDFIYFLPTHQKWIAEGIQPLE